MIDESGQSGALSDSDRVTLLKATGRDELSDALLWISEGRPLAGGVPAAAVLLALVSAAEAGIVGSEPAVRVTVRRALHSTLDTSANLVLTGTITPPHRYEAALTAVACRTPTGTLTDITVAAVWAAQSENPVVIEALGLVAGLAWRDLQDRAAARGTPLPGAPDGAWSSGQISTAFAIIDDIVCDRLEPQLPGAVVSRPVELLLETSTGWDKIEALRSGGVSYGTLLAQRDVGSAWSAHRNRTNTELSKLMITRVLAALDAFRVSYWSTVGPQRVAKSYLGSRAGVSGNTPGQLAVVTRRQNGSAGFAVLTATARDGGTARKTAATLLKLPAKINVQSVLVLFGTGWAERGESDDLIRAYGGRLYTENTLSALAATAAAV